jgi:hypothetical protein
VLHPFTNRSEATSNRESNAMTYLEMITAISDRKEVVIYDRATSIQTDKYHYSRHQNGEWEQIEKAVPEEQFLPLVETVPKIKKKR